MKTKNMYVVGWSALALVLSLGVVACGDDDVAPMTDAGMHDGGDADAGELDAGGADGGSIDDAGAPDSGAADAGPADCTPTVLLVTTSDYVDGALATYELATGVVTV